MYPPDLALAERDSSLPVAFLLDEVAFSQRLQRAWPELEAEDARVTYLRHKTGTSLLAGFEVTTSSGPLTLYAKGYRGADGGKWSRARARAGASGLPHAVFEDHHTLVCPFPLDLALPSLALLVDDATRPTLLAKLLGADAPVVELALETLHHRPERRYVGRIGVGDDRIALKLHAADGFPTARANAKALVSREGLQIPRLVGRSRRHRLVALAWRPGPVLADVLRRPTFDPCVVHDVGAALWSLHRQAPTALRVRDRSSEVRTIGRLAAYLAFLLPDRAPWIREIASALAHGLERLQEPGHAIHGDFHAAQVVLSPDGVVFLDLDEAVAGDPASDLGTFLAHLTRAALDDQALAARVDAIAAALLEGYRSARGEAAPAHLELAVAVALFGLAPQPFRYREPDWPVRVEALLALAERYLNVPRRGRVASPSARVRGTEPT